MSPVVVKRTAIPDVLLLSPQRFPDARGYFVETYNERAFSEAGIPTHFVQDNEAFSERRGTIRGLHFQRSPASQAKLVRVLRGRIFDVALDLRLGSPSYGAWVSEVLTAEGGEQLYIPHGFAHGYCTLEVKTEVAYKVDDYYAPQHEDGIVWNDPQLAIAWPSEGSEPLVSHKDATLGLFASLISPFRFEVGP
jgi:dTDP-4-dehydrorhamnose 3,5-epimerase